MRFQRSLLPNLFRLMLLVVIALAATGPTRPGLSMPLEAPAAQAPATTNSIKIEVYDAADVSMTTKLTDFKFLISVDNTGDPFDPNPDCEALILDTDGVTKVRNPNYPGTCDMPSIRTVPGWAPIYAQGDQSHLLATTGDVLPDGKYLVSVLADGYKIDGEHFTIPIEGPADSTVPIKVRANKLPLPAATMTIMVFDDKTMTNGQHDGPSEQGLPGFRASINDIAGEVTTDLYGNPLCTEYERDATGSVILDADGVPANITTLGVGCYSDNEGYIRIPNIVPLRYDVLVIPPDGTDWVQTTTLEGSQGWDTWLQEGSLGMDNEFVIAAEPFPWTVFGFVKPNEAQLSGTGTIKGVVMGVYVNSPSTSGLPFQGTVWGGLSHAFLQRPIDKPWISLNDFQNGDTAVWVGQGNADGSFTIPNVPAGNYLMTYWDEKQHYILDWVQVSVKDGQVSDIGIQMLTGWFAEFYGTVFEDSNENGRQDPGEPGIPNYLVVLKDRDNTEIDRMSIAVLTDPNGYYIFEKAYPMSSWMVLEAYSDLYHTTGITFQAWNQPEETTVIGNGVDVGVLPILGQAGRLDWGVKAYDADQNGGIVGTVFYDTVRSEDDARYAGVEPWQPGIAGLTVNLYMADQDPLTAEYHRNADGSIAKALGGQLLMSTTTETYTRAKNCTARDGDGTAVDFPALAMPDVGADCLEGPPMGLQFDAEFATLDGNYGFTEACFGAGGYDPVAGACADGSAPTSLPPGDYLVEVEIPNDKYGNPILLPTREEDRNVFDGDTFTPAIPPSECAGPLHTVDVAGIGPDGLNATVNPGLADSGGSRFEGMDMPLCGTKLIVLNNGRSIAPVFNFFTPVPIPGKWKGYIIDDLNLSIDPTQLFFGEKVGLQMPVGLYDYKGRLVETIHSDKNGVFEVLLPSSATVNVASPSGMAANVYYMYGNDAGQPGKPNFDYNPQYRSIGAAFEIYPGTILPSDLAPVQNGVFFQAPGQQISTLALCSLNRTDTPVDDITPELFRVDKPYVNNTGAFTITGYGFGDTKGSGVVKFDNTVLQVTAWNNTSITVNTKNNATGADIRPGAYQLTVTASNGLKTVNGLTFHVLGGNYNPTLFEVGPGLTGTRKYNSEAALYDGLGRGPIQHAIDAAVATGQPALVVVYPDTYPNVTNDLTGNPDAYLENLIISGPIKLQGVGPGGFYVDANGDTIGTAGVTIDGRAVGGDSPYTGFWRSHLASIWENPQTRWDRGLTDGDGLPSVPEGAVITVLSRGTQFNVAFLRGARAQIDGLTIQGGDQQGFPNNLNQIGGGPTGLPAEVVVQGGGIFVNGYANYLRISNNIVRSNGGAYAGGIRIGTPHIPNNPATQVNENSNNNNTIDIIHNRILANGGTNLAGAIGLFAGANNYEVAYNDLCGNFSAEYGGAVSHYGLSPNGKIHDNRMYFNSSYDEGGGIMIAGELPASPTTLSTGAGAVNVYNNLLQSNLANDDGGGLRFLMAGNFTYNVYNNIIANNISTHEGGGVSLFDAPNVRLYNNTIMKNLTTATAMTSDGTPAPAGLSTVRNSNLLQNTLPVTAAKFSNPLLFNNIFWDNRAGSFVGGTVVGIGIEGDTSPVYNWDMGVADGTGMLSLTNTLIQVPYGVSDPSNKIGEDPLAVAQFDTSVAVFSWRGNPNFLGASIVAANLPVTLMGDYHLQPGSPAINAGAFSKSAGGPLVFAPLFDYDNGVRPMGGLMDIGADELGNAAFPAVLPPPDDLIYNLLLPFLSNR